MATKASIPARTGMTGSQLRAMFSTATQWLEKNAAAVDALNVFPVPDGDTGTNMLLTMKAAISEAARIESDEASEVAAAMAHGALMGARGNSGVILSQMLRGLAHGLKGAGPVSPGQMAHALQEATAAAYRGLSKPVEGTMLTVIKDIARAAREVADNNRDMADLMESSAHEAKVSVARTPELLPVLKEAGVVDAGGQGIYIMFEGMAHHLRGKASSIILLSPDIALSSLPPALPAGGKKVYGYCTEFVIRGAKATPDRIRKKLDSRGDSLLVVGEEDTIKVHIHTPDPGSVLKIGTAAGSLHGLKIENMDDQHEGFVEMRRALLPAVKIATVAVVSGNGLEEIFRSLGATATIPGGQTMNPSCEEIIRAIDFVPSDKVIVLPNNKNVILAARQAVTLTKKQVAVVPTTSMPEGVAALVAFNQERELEQNLADMDKAFRRTTPVEIAVAVRSARVGKLWIKKGQHIGFAGGELVAAAQDINDVIVKSLAAAGAEKAELLTVYYGAGISAAEASALADSLSTQYPDLQIEVVDGGQPHYKYIMSLE